MNCFDDKNRHIGKLYSLFRVSTDPDLDAVVRWCPKCGAVVVDREHDNKIFGSYVKMKFPELTRKALGK